MSGLQQLSDTEYSKLRRGLLGRKGSSRQRQFLEAAKDRGAFLKCFEGIPLEGQGELPLAQRMSESEFKDPPIDTEQRLFEDWAALKPGIACRSAYWAQVTLRHVAKQRIDPCYLAANGGTAGTGEERIDQVLADSTLKAEENIDKCVRMVLRRLGGLPEVRGNRSVYVDCPFARAWWRERTVRQALGTDNNVEAALDVRSLLRLSNAHWEKVIDRIVFRNSTFGDESIRGAFICVVAKSLAERPAEARASRFPAAELQRLCRRASALQGTRELSILKRADIAALMRELVQNTQLRPAS